MKTNRDITMNRVILGGAFIIIAVLGVFGVFNGKNLFKKAVPAEVSLTSQDIELQGDMPVAGLKDLEFSAVSADISIERTSSSTVRVQVTGSSRVKPELIVEKSGSTGSFKIKWPKSINTGARNMEMLISLPAAYTESIDINTVSGEVYIPGNSDFLRMQANTVSGDLNVSDLTAEICSISSVSGGIDVIQGSVDRLELSSTSGDINYFGGAGHIQVSSISGETTISLNGLSGDINISNTSGDILLGLPESISATVDFGTVSGDLETEIPLMTTGAKKNSLSGTIGSGVYQIEASTVSGDIKLRKN